MLDPFLTQKVLSNIRKILRELPTNLPQTYDINVCLLDSKGQLIDFRGTQPFHVIAFESCVKSMRKYLSPKHGEVLITNDPYSGNTRLCDLVFMQGVFSKAQANDFRYIMALQVSIPQLLNKKMSSLTDTVENEGYRIPPTPLNSAEGLNDALLDYLCQSGIKKDELISLFIKIINQLKKACERVQKLEKTIGNDVFTKVLAELNHYSEQRMKTALHQIPDGDYIAHDFMDDDGFQSGPVRIQCRLTVQGENILVNFLGSAKQVKGSINCNYTHTLGACFWVLRGLLHDDIPINSGAFKAFSVEAPEGTVVNAKYPAPLLGGYFETSKRIVDVLYQALSKAMPYEIAAMNGGSSNVAFVDFGDKFYLDTIGCGAGAHRQGHGISAAQTELHNISSSSIEDLESHYPLQVIQHSLRDSSGAEGKFNGGDGMTRGYKFLAPAKLTLLSDRRHFKPHGLFGGVSGQPGENIVNKSGEKKKIYNEKCVLSVNAGDTYFVSSPGGAAWGKKEEVVVEEEES